MNLDAINKWLTLVANLGVVAGFLLLALQLNQNTRAIQLESARALSRESQPAEVAFMGEDAASAYSTAVLRPAELTPAQLYQMWGYLNAGMQPVLSSWVAWKQGYSSDDAWTQARLSAFAYIDFRVGRLVWNEAKAFYPAEMVVEIDRELAAAEPGTNDRQLLRLLSEIKQLEAPELSDEGTTRSEQSSVK